MILLNQAGKTSHQDICDSLDLFAKEVMPEFHDRQPAQDQWKQDVLNRKIVLRGSGYRAIRSVLASE